MENKSWSNDEMFYKNNRSALHLIRLLAVKLHQEYRSWKDITESICKGNDYLRGYRDGLRKAVEITKREIEEYEEIYR